MKNDEIGHTELPSKEAALDAIESSLAEHGPAEDDAAQIVKDVAAERR